MHHPLMAAPIAFDPETQESAIRRIVTLLQAARPPSQLGGRVVAEALDSYKAAVVELTLQGSLDVDRCAELMEIVARIEAGS
jgi:hypothetical protein